MPNRPAPLPSQLRSCRRRCVRLGVLLVTVLTAASASAQEKAAVQPTEKPFLWVIEGKTPSYLYGTIHVPDDRVLALPKVVEEAVDACDALYTEIPMDMGVLMAAAAKMMLPAEKTLADVLPKKLYERTDKYLQSKGFSIAPLSRFKVWAVMAQLALLDYAEELATKQPLDMLIYTRASAKGKEVGGVETVDEQIAAFEALTEKEQIKTLAKTLDMLEEAQSEGKSITRGLVDSYLKGDVQELVKVMHEYLDLNDPIDKKLFDKLVTERNKRMAKRAAKMIKENRDKSFFFAFGAGHMGGKMGVIPLLKSQGFKLRRLNAGDAGKLP